MLLTVQKIGPALDLFTIARPEWRVSEVAEALETPKSSAHALLTTMAEIGLLERTAQRRYRLGWRLLVLGRTVMLSADYRTVVARTLRRTVERWGETMHFGVHDRGGVVYIEKVEGRHSRPIPTQTGVRLPAHASAVGKVLLAHRDDDGADDQRLACYTPHTINSRERLADELARVRATGIAFDRDEAVVGVWCAGAPIRARDGHVVGAISISAARERFERHHAAYVGLVREIAQSISRDLGAPEHAGALELLEVA